MIREGRAMRHGRRLTWAQVLMAANTPMLLRAGLVTGRTDVGVLASGQVVGVLTDLPSCAELVEGVVEQAVRVLDRLGSSVTSAPS
jgi:NAD(P)H-dependent flavin oxidoreductase YrpB (nitropropane dioxygenase family)